MKAARVDGRYRLAVAVRTLAATAGGYAVAAAVAAALSLALAAH
ncbi:putative iron uptake protein, partial [Acidovorax delafieldii 2AN]